MIIGPVPAQTDVFTALRSFLLGVLPNGVEVIKGQVNRVAEPQGSDFVVFWPLRQERLRTNVDTYADSSFIASVSNQTMTVTQTNLGTIVFGHQLLGVGVVDGTTIVNQISGTPGGPGNYVVSISQILPQLEYASGSSAVEINNKVAVQLDVHGPSSADNATLIRTLFRDQYAYQQFAPGSIAPLYCDDPTQIPFINAEQAFEDRWVIVAYLQANQVITISQAFAEKIAVGLINVDAAFPDVQI